MRIDDVSKRLSELSLLKDNWDSYGGSKPTKEALDIAKSLLETLFICPSPDGGITLYLGKEEEITVEISSEGKIVKDEER